MPGILNHLNFKQVCFLFDTLASPRTFNLTFFHPQKYVSPNTDSPCRQTRTLIGIQMYNNTFRCKLVVMPKECRSQTLTGGMNALVLSRKGKLSTRPDLSVHG